jgi:formimidoylglutamate deiminase
MTTYELPAMVNAHSHAFQRDLRGVAERPSPGVQSGDDFWSWREAMYRLASALDPDSIYEVSRRAFAEMTAAGYGAVGEFHYVHHQPDGTPYADPNAMALAVAEAARAAGITIVLLPAAYNRAGWNGGDLAPTPGQRRFCDRNVDNFLARVDALRGWAQSHEGVHVGVAAHSVRAVPASWLDAIAAYAEEHGLVRHVHAHEQPRELDECRAEYGMTPIALLERTGFLGSRSSVIHGIHVDAEDIGRLAATDTVVVSCPTTEGNLGDVHFPAMDHHGSGVRIAIGSDSQVRIDPFEETRELETLARRERGSRAALLAAHGDLWAELVRAGRVSLGLEDAGTIAIDRDHPDLRGVDESDLPLAVATCASAAVVSAPPGAGRAG